MIMIAEKIVSRGRADLSGPPASIIETISATSITVTATARIRVPNGSPTRCATTSAWCTEASTEPISARPAMLASSGPTGTAKPRPTRAIDSKGTTEVKENMARLRK